MTDHKKNKKESKSIDNDVDNIRHYNQKPRRKAEFIRPPHNLKAKVGSGGLSDEILNKAQELLEENTVDFIPLAEMYLDSLLKGIEKAKEQNNRRKNSKKESDQGPDSSKEYIISAMLYPAVQLKANGAMLKYPLVTRIANRLVHFLEVLAETDEDALEIVQAFYTAIRAVIAGRVTGNAGETGQELFSALDNACLRYFNRAPYNKKSP